jgi:hypothetical protein
MWKRVFSGCAFSVVAICLMLLTETMLWASPKADPTKGAVPLPCLSEKWNAFLIIDNKGVGIWTVASFNVFAQYGCPEVVGLDDKGRCIILVSYSGKWTPFKVIEDGLWLGGLTHGDVDPRIKGSELYTGGKKGNMYQVVAYGNGALDYRRIAYLPGREIHTILSGDLDPRSKGNELFVFTRPGGLYRVTPTAPHGRFQVDHLQDLQGRVRQAEVLPQLVGNPLEIATVSRTGRLELLQITPQGPLWKRIYDDQMGKGRLAVRKGMPGKSTVVYTTHDDGRIMRHERLGDQSWRTESIYLGPQGPRGIAAGQFHEDPNVETVAVFGYSRKVQLLTRTPEGWQVETLFEDLDKGHWLSTAEVDGRNNTRELIASGYSGRITLLSRPPGYGRPELTQNSVIKYSTKK